MAIKTRLGDGSGTDKEATVLPEGELLVSVHPCPPLTPQKSKLFSQHLTDDGLSTGEESMLVPVGVTDTDGVCADHTGPTYTFTSVGGGLTGAVRVQITDTGAAGHGVLGIYAVSSVTDDNTVELTTDPTDGTNETGMDWIIPEQEFWVPASSTADRYITAVNVVIADAAAKFSQFGAITALTNGCQFFYERIDATVYIHKAMKTNWDFVRMTLTQTPGAEMKVQKDIEGKTDAYVPCMDFTKIMPPYGIKLDMGSNQRLVIKVRDDVSAIDSFNSVAYGFDRFP